MLHASPDLDHLRRLTDQALHGHDALGHHHPPAEFVTVNAAHLDVLLRSLDPGQLRAATEAHNRIGCLSVHRTIADVDRIATELTTAAGRLNSALAESDLTTIRPIGADLSRLIHRLKDATAR